MVWCGSFSVVTLVALLLPTFNLAAELLTAPYHQNRLLNGKGVIHPEDNYNNRDHNDALSNHLSTPNTINDDQIQVMSRYLARVLLQPWPDNGLPLLYIEDSAMDDYPTTAGLQNNEPGTAAVNSNKQQLYDVDEEDVVDVEDPMDGAEADDEDAVKMNHFKRTRYYRKYPWKRQNAKQPYDADNRYLCQPSKDDVFRLLVALHDSKGGNRRPIHFCNRKRPAHTIFTNIRFLGK